SCHGRSPNGPPHAEGVAIRNAPVARAPTVGHKKFRFRLSNDVLRQASRGPTAVSNRRRSATGMLTLLKNGGPTVTLCPWIHSESTGNKVPQSTVKQASRRRRLLNKKLDSREINDSNLCSPRRCERFFQ